MLWAQLLHIHASPLKGANPGLFSLKLMHHAATFFATYDDVEHNSVLAHETIENGADEIMKAHDEVEYDRVTGLDAMQVAHVVTGREAAEKHIVGSATALVAVLRVSFFFFFFFFFFTFWLVI